MSTQTNQTIDVLTGLESIVSSFNFWVGITIGLVTIGYLIYHLLYREVRLQKNLSKEVIFFNFSDDCNFETEINALESGGLIKNIKGPYKEKAQIQEISNQSVVVASIKETGEGLDRLIDRCKQKNIPLILYRKHGLDRIQLAEEDDLLDKYRWIEICRSPIRLMNTIFTTLITFNHE